MSLTLGEKLRQAREERGFTLSEVAEQTRISSLYLESIENDDYRILPGGIFNKGFIKSFAKFVGINEQEALADYTHNLAEFETGRADDLKVYRPEVLTDDRSSSSMMPTIIVAGLILALMTIGILYGVRYLREPSEPAAANNVSRTSANTGAENLSNTDSAPSNVPDMATLRVEFKSLSQSVLLTATSDGTRSDNKIAAGSTVSFEPKASLILNYNKWNAQVVQLTINGKPITLPAVPLDSKDKRIEFTISADNIAQIWRSGKISTEVPAAMPDANAVAAPANKAVETPAQPKPSVPARTPTPRPSETPRIVGAATPPGQ